MWNRSDAKSSDWAVHLALIGHVFLMFVATRPQLSIPPGPMFAVLFVVNLGMAAAALHLRRHAAMTAAMLASQMIVTIWAVGARVAPWPDVALLAVICIAAFALLFAILASRKLSTPAAPTAIAAFIGGQIAAIFVGASAAEPLFLTLLGTHVLLVVAMLVVAWKYELHVLAIVAVPIAAIATALARAESPAHEMVFAGILYALFVAYPFLVGRRMKASIEPALAAVLGSVPFFFFARHAIEEAGFGGAIGLLPLAQAVVLSGLLALLLRIDRGREHLSRLALVAGAALAFITVAVPLQLEKQWITIAWALEGAALAWLYTRIRHRGLLVWAAGLLSIVFIRLVFNPAVLSYHQPDGMPIFNWYLYTYLVAAAAFFAAAWFAPAEERKGRAAVNAGGTVLLFLLVNIEIADFYSVGRSLTFDFSASLAQDLTYTIGWALFSIALLIAGIILRQRAPRMAGLGLLTVTVVKCFAHDLARLGGLYRVGSLLGLAASLVIAGILLQRFMLMKNREEQAS